LKCGSTPLLNFIEGAVMKVQCVSTVLSKRPQTATVMCKHLTSKGAPNSNYNAKFHGFKEAPTAVVMCKYLTFKGAPNNNCNV